MFGMQMGKMGGVGQMTLAQRIAYMFANSEPGAWYDPSDMSTLFQDSAGTTPVTAVEQPVGRMLDKSGRGNHASQATTTKRPTYSRRVNLLTKTEQFDDAAWGKVLCSVTPNSSTAPDGTLTADLIIPGASSGTRYVSTAGSGNSIYKVRIKNGGLRYATFGNAAAVTVVDLDSGTISTTSGGGMSFAITGLGDGWYEVTCTNPTATAYQYQLFAGVDGTGGNIATDGVAGIYAWGASLTLATDAHLPYQYVNTDTDYDADPAKFPAYLCFDGVDDALQTGDIDFTGTDKMTVWAGVTKLSDAAAGIVCELSANKNSNAGVFALFAPESAAANISLYSKGTLPAAGVGTLALGQAAPKSVVLAGIGDISGDIATIRVAGASNTLAQDQGTGNYGNYPLYIGARAGTSLFFNGRLGCLIIRGAQSSLSQIEAGELYTKQKMRLP